jgi:hypothetical protein
LPFDSSIIDYPNYAFDPVHYKLIPKHIENIPKIPVIDSMEKEIAAWKRS